MGTKSGLFIRLLTIGLYALMGWASHDESYKKFQIFKKKKKEEKILAYSV